MVFDHIEKLKSEYTDKYVVVDDSLPELKRFTGQTGMVRTVNMNGRALVEFDAFANIGWYDIEIDFLTIVDAPLPKEEKKAAAPKAKAAAPSKLDKAREASGKAKAGGAMSAADVLAAARGGGEKPAAKSGGKMSAADVLAAARGGAKADAKPAAKQDSTKMSAADVLAAARGGAKPATAKPDTSAKATPSAEKKPAAPAAKVDPSKMSVADILAAARANKSADAAPAAEEEPVAEEKPAAAEGKKSNEEILAEVAAKKALVDFNTIGVASSDKKDDLKIISGIGPFIEEKLNALDIFTFEQISKFTPEISDKVTEAIEFFPGRIQRDDWVSQAKKLVGEQSAPAATEAPAESGPLPTNVADIVAWCKERDSN